MWVAGALCAGVFPSHADQPSPFPSPTPSATSSVPTQATPQGAPPTANPESNPFPSPTAQTQVPSRNGYVAGGYVGGNGSGGQVEPVPGSTSTPTAFPSSQASGFWLDLLGRLGPSYLAELTYDNLNLRGGDNPLISYAQGRFEYEPRSSLAAFGLAMISVQRSTSNANMTGFGIGGSLLPDLNSAITPYASLFVYPHLETGGVAATFTSADAGVLFVPKKRGGFFFRLGGSLRTGLPSTTSPSSVSALQLGLGTSF